MKILRAIWCTFNLWSLKTFWQRYATEKEWVEAGSPLDLTTAWEVAKGIWLD